MLNQMGRDGHNFCFIFEMSFLEQQAQCNTNKADWGSSLSAALHIQCHCKLSDLHKS